MQRSQKKIKLEKKKAAMLERRSSLSRLKDYLYFVREKLHILKVHDDEGDRKVKSEAVEDLRL